MADRYPKSIEEITAENAELRATVDRLQLSLASRQAEVIARDAEIMRLSKPKAAPRILEKTAADKFKRPAYSR